MDREVPIQSADRHADVVIVVPPFANYADPCLAAGLLKAAVSDKGISCRVVYGNLMLAVRLMVDLYNRIAGSDIEAQIGERFFAASAHPGMPPCNIVPSDGPWSPDILKFTDFASNGVQLSSEECQIAQTACELFLSECVERIAQYTPRVVGFSSTLQQTNSSIALARLLKQRYSEIITVMGGNNCSGLMGEEIAAKCDVIDYVFQGEADTTFPDFCVQYLTEGVLPKERLIGCRLQMAMDSLPIPNFDDYYDQAIIEPEDGWIFFESSRGCWWGQKHHCAFCGLMGPELAYRVKSSRRLVDELVSLRSRYPRAVRYFAADLIAPKDYYNTAFAELTTVDFNRKLYYEVKANITRDQLLKLKSAGVVAIQPGIESLSSRVLQSMSKGNTAVINVRLLRDCRELNVLPTWNILVEIPGDEESDYHEQLKVIPLLEHFYPPVAVGPIVIQRFSPYHFDAERFGISDLQPAHGYELAFPPEYDKTKVAYTFRGGYRSAGREHPHLVRQLCAAVNQWISRWNSPNPPKLLVRRLNSTSWLVIDMRSCAVSPTMLLDREHYNALVTLRSGLPVNAVDDTALWLMEVKLAALIDGRVISLVCDQSIGAHQVAEPLTNVREATTARAAP